MRNRNNYLKMEIKRTPEQVALAHQLGSKTNKADSMAAAEAIAAVVSEPLLKVIQQAPVFSNFFARQTYGPDEAPTIPMTPLFDTRAPGYMLVWSASAPGGLATNHMQGANDLVVQVRNYNGAADVDKKWVRNQQPRLNVISDALTRLAQEVLIKQNRDATTVLMASLANSFIDGNSANTAATNYQIFRSATAGVFQMDDFNTIITKYRRIVPSWVGGTPIGTRPSITDLCGSPEWLGFVRSIAYQPVNTRNGATTTSGASSLAATDEVRNKIYNSGGLPNLFDVDLHEFNELGVGQIYNNLFATYATGTYTGNGGVSTATFNSATEQVVIGLNLDWFDLVSLSQTDEAGAEWSLIADDQYPLRSDKVGWYGSVNQGFISVDARGKLGLIF